MAITDDPRVDHGDDGRRLHITLGPEAGDVARVMAASQQIDIRTLMSRALGLYRYWHTLPSGTDMMIRHPDGRLDRLVIPRPEGGG